MPSVIVAVKVSPGRAKYFLESLTVNGFPLVVPGEKNDDLSVVIPQELISPAMRIRGKFRRANRTVSVRVLAWSSALEDNLATSVDERWVNIDVKVLADGTPAVIARNFNPTGK